MLLTVEVSGEGYRLDATASGADCAPQRAKGLETGLQLPDPDGQAGRRAAKEGRRRNGESEGFNNLNGFAYVRIFAGRD